MTAPKTSDLDVLFARRLRQLRKARGVSGHALAELAGLPRESVYRIESGSRAVTVGEAAVLARVLGCDVARMLSADPLVLVLGDAR